MNWAQALYHDAEFNLEDAQKTAFSEWTKEATDEEGGVQSHIAFPAFHHLLFEIADVWCPAISEQVRFESHHDMQHYLC